MLAACAVVEAPPGGPEDRIRPHLAAVEPDSGAVGLGEVSVLRFTFSEKMNRTPAGGWLNLYPERKIRSTKWKGAKTAIVRLMEPLPADTVVVIEIEGGMQDAHKVKNVRSRRFPIATGDSIPVGSIGGALVMGDSAVTRGVIELLPAGPDSVAIDRRPVLRRTVTDPTGGYRFDWLPADAEAWLLRAYHDGDSDLRRGEREAVRMLPDTLRLTDDARLINVGALTLYAPGTPGTVHVDSFTAPPLYPNLRGWGMAVAEDDTGWSPAGTAAPPATHPLDPAGGSSLPDTPPGDLRILIFADVDGDSLFGAVPGSLVVGLPDSLAAADSNWYHEPWWEAAGPRLEPGLEADFTWIPDPPNYTPAEPPPPALPDSAASALPDSLRELLEED